MKILKCKAKEQGYVLLLMMLLIGSLGLYLSYQLSLQKIKSQSWQVQKTAAEIAYWMDIEYNYFTDNNIVSNTSAGQDARNAIKFPDLINNNYLPYGQYRPTTFQTDSSHTIVSEFLCSPLPGVNADEGALQLLDNFNATCPTAGGLGGYIDQNCTITSSGQQNSINSAYYSCGNVMADASTLPTTMRKAQYYANANNIALGNDKDVFAGVGLILRTPGNTTPYIANSSAQIASLPNGSAAQALIALLPTSSFDAYSGPPGVTYVGLGSYISKNQAAYNNPNIPFLSNDRYSKIIDMGLVQAVDINSHPTTCYGWSGDTKIGVNSTYNGKKDPGVPTSGTTGKFPPTCIHVNVTKYQSSCPQGIDVFYTMYRSYLNVPLTKKNPSKNMHYATYTDVYIRNNGDGKDVYLSQGTQNPAKANTNLTYTSNDVSTPTYTWLAYFVRCTRANV